MPTLNPGRLIAEIGSVHDGSFGNACKLIEAAASCGAHAVKFQTHIADAESIAGAPAPAHFSAEDRLPYFARTAFDEEQWRGLTVVAQEQNVQFLSSPFSLEAVDLLEKIEVEVYKVPSGEVTNLPLLERIAMTGKPVLLSSGMSSWSELDAAVSLLREGGSLTIMQCSSVYPCPPERTGLNVICEMRERYGLPVGFSDHTVGAAIPLAAAALGATVIEKHFTFSRRMYGSDAQYSMEPEEFSDLAGSLNDVWKALGQPVDKDDLNSYRDMKRIFEKSIVTARPIDAGAMITRADMAFKKPGDGLPPSSRELLLGRRMSRSLPANHKLSEDDFQ